MYRKPITAAAIDHVDLLLAEGKDHALIAGRTGITEYVIGVIAGDKLRAAKCATAGSVCPTVDEPLSAASMRRRSA